MNSSASAQEHQGSPDRFGYEWTNYSTILPEHKGQLERWLGSTGLASMEGKRVLDVGCGMGRNPYWMLKAGARELVAIDADDGSLAAARRNLAEFPQARVERCSVYDLGPERFGEFDVITCIGVLHHLADPDDALTRMWSCVAKGGSLELWCYAKEGNELVLPLIELLRIVGSKAPISVTHGIARGVTLAAWPMLKLAPWRTDYYRRIGSLSFKNVESIVFDQMLPRIANYWTEQDMRRLVRPLGGRVAVEFVQGNSWHVKVTRE